VPVTISATPARAPTFAVIVLSQGNRPVELRHCLDSLLSQTRVSLDIVVVGNGWAPPDLGPGVRSHALVDNIGIPAGRNVGARLTTSEFVWFFDDDAWVPTSDLLDRVAVMFAGQPRLAAVQPRVCDIDGTTLRRWVPRARVGDPLRSGPAFTVEEGVTIVRRAAFDAVGGWPDNFFYGHEGIDLAWRMRDANWDLRYAADLVVHHPATDPGRHGEFYRRNARNRVWVARRNLPAVLVPVYLGVWTLITVARLVRQPADLRTWWAGFLEGWHTDPGRRQPMRWSTVIALTRLGQPPII